MFMLLQTIEPEHHIIVPPIVEKSKQCFISQYAIFHTQINILVKSLCFIKIIYVIIFIEMLMEMVESTNVYILHCFDM